MGSTTVEDLTAGILKDLVSSIAEYGRNGAVLAGHYSVAEHMSEVSHNRDVEKRCFDLGIRLIKQAEQKGLVNRLVLWVNDIGIDVRDRIALKQSYRLPASYRQILDEGNFDPTRLDMLFESTMRNKGSILARKIERRQPSLIRRVPNTQSGLVRCIEDLVCAGKGKKELDAFVIAGPDGQDLVLKEGSHPKCCLILGTLFTDVMKRFSVDYIVNIFNSVYTARLQYGIYVAREVFQNPLPMWNLYVDEKEVFQAEFHEKLNHLNAVATTNGPRT